MSDETSRAFAVSVRVMAKRLTVALLLIIAAMTLFLAYRWYDRLPWLEASVRVHSERGSTNCGHLTNSGYEAHPMPMRSSIALSLPISSAVRSSWHSASTASMSSSTARLSETPRDRQLSSSMEWAWLRGQIPSWGVAVTRRTNSSYSARRPPAFPNYVASLGHHLRLRGTTFSGEIDVTVATSPSWTGRPSRSAFLLSCRKCDAGVPALNYRSFSFLDRTRKNWKQSAWFRTSRLLAAKYWEPGMHSPWISRLLSGRF